MSRFGHHPHTDDEVHPQILRHAWSTCVTSLFMILSGLCSDSITVLYTLKYTIIVYSVSQPWGFLLFPKNGQQKWFVVSSTVGLHCFFQWLPKLFLIALLDFHHVDLWREIQKVNSQLESPVRIIVYFVTYMLVQWKSQAKNDGVKPFIERH